jgi:hypothetical protein
MTSGSEVMCRKKVDTPWSIYRDFTVHINFSHYVSILVTMYYKKYIVLYYKK